MREKDEFEEDNSDFEDTGIKDNYNEDYDPDEESSSNINKESNDDSNPGINDISDEESESDVDDIINGDNDSESDVDSDNNSAKRLFLLLGVIVLVFVIIIGGFFVYNKYFISPTGAMTLDDLHRANIEGEESDKNYVYNGFSFVYVDGLWYTQIQRENLMWNIPLHFGPRDLEGINIIGKGINDSFKKNEVYITFDPTLKPLSYVALSAAELSLNLVKGIGVTPIAACLINETEACKNRPIITCESGEAAIYLKQDDEAKVILDGNCIIIQGRDYDLVKATDRFLLQWYRIMN